MEKWYFNQYVDFNDKWNIIHIKKKYKPDLIFNRIKNWNLYNNYLLDNYKIIPSFKIV